MYALVHRSMGTQSGPDHIKPIVQFFHVWVNIFFITLPIAVVILT
jgi:hypothetical protein